jgi:hypothetical protein
MLIDIYADRLADERELLQRNPGLHEVMKFAADKEAQAQAVEDATKWLADPGTLARLRAIGGAPADTAPRATRLTLGRRDG